jgi:hypothetical protein
MPLGLSATPSKKDALRDSLLLSITDGICKHGENLRGVTLDQCGRKAVEPGRSSGTLGNLSDLELLALNIDTVSCGSIGVCLNFTLPSSLVIP